eukprot:jgi/Bigna1/83036/fgenesh1_pg.101_\
MLKRVVYLSSSLVIAVFAIMVAMAGGPTVFMDLIKQKFQADLVVDVTSNQRKRGPFEGADLVGRRALVTGANRGLGKAISQVLLENHADSVLMTGRNIERCRTAAAEIIARESGNGKLEGGGLGPRVGTAELDLGSFASIDRFVEELKSKSTSATDAGVNTIVLNAAVAGIVPQDRETGMNPILGVNFVGNVYLLDSLLRANLVNKDTSIIVVTSGAHVLGDPESFPIWTANPSFCYSPGRLEGLRASSWRGGAGMNPKKPFIVYWNPGPVDTGLGEDSVPSLLFPIYWLMKRMFFVEPLKVARTAAYLLSDPPPVRPGTYFNMREIAQPHPFTGNSSFQQRVYEETKGLICRLSNSDQEGCIA